MSEQCDSAWSRLIRTAVMLTMILGVCTFLEGQNSASGSGVKSGTMVETHSDKRVVQTGRWYVTRQFTVDFAVQCADHTYCGEVTTTVVNEVDDLMASKGHPVELLDSGKDIDITLQNGRRIRAHQVSPNKCLTN